MIMKNMKWEFAEKVEEKINDAEKRQNLLKIGFLQKNGFPVCSVLRDRVIDNVL